MCFQLCDWVTVRPQSVFESFENRSTRHRWCVEPSVTIFMYKLDRRLLSCAAPGKLLTYPQYSHGIELMGICLAKRYGPPTDRMWREKKMRMP